MKKVVFLLAATLSIFLMVSCKGKKDAQTENNSSELQQYQEDVYLEPTESLVDTIMITSGKEWSICKENDDGFMIAWKQPARGSKVQLVKLGTDYVQKSAQRKYESGTIDPACTWFQVIYEGNRYWTRDIFIAEPGTQSGIIIRDNTYIYSSADDMSMTTETLSIGSFVAYKPNGNGGNNFSEIITYNGQPYGKSSYVERGSISNDPIILEYFSASEKLGATKDLKDTVREEVSEMIEYLYSVNADKYMF